MRLWLDDERKPPKGFTAWAKTATEAIAELSNTQRHNRRIQTVSLDHDLGHKPTRGCKEKTGMTVVEWMVENDCWPEEIIVHSWNVPAGRRMCDMINRYGPYPKNIRPTPAEALPFPLRNV